MLARDPKKALRALMVGAKGHSRDKMPDKCVSLRWLLRTVQMTKGNLEERRQMVATPLLQSLLDRQIGSSPFNRSCAKCLRRSITKP